MADSRQPEDGTPQWSPSAGQEAPSPLGANGYSSSFRTCQTAPIMSSGPYAARENGFNGDLTGAHAITAEQVSARIVQEVTAEAVAVLKGEQESQRLPSVCVALSLTVSPLPLFPEEETMEALTAEYEEEEVEEDSAEAALDEQWSGDEPEPDSPQPEPLEQAQASGQAQDEHEAAASAASDSSRSLEEEEEEAEGEESLDTGLSCPLLPCMHALQCLI
uniref:Uncharacterized protein n=1 Tax=Periophthalmus magnuspinnatus TaxID=409849 RepID=A0A3B3ZYD2_9GOBI